VDVLFGNLGEFLTRFGGTIGLFVCSAIASLILGVILAAMRVSPVPAMRATGTVYVTLLRNTPLTLVLFFFALGFTKLFFYLPFFLLAVIGLSLYTAAFVCETVRGGISTVSEGQAEAARALGFGFTQTLTLVVLPQAVRSVMPPLTSVQIALLKNTTLCGLFGVSEAFYRMRFFTNNEPGQRIGIFLSFALIFVLLVEIVSFFANRLERHWRVP
jgi:glutamate transport system permease protein